MKDDKFVTCDYCFTCSKKPFITPDTLETESETVGICYKNDLVQGSLK